ncbi:hypothetical protein ALTERO38_50139 [Alteromonas sp. 38]|nr:hypothetical protein ALTERO38_50139 [Alteromonas sp. 38]
MRRRIQRDPALVEWIISQIADDQTGQVLIYCNKLCCNKC